MLFQEVFLERDLSSANVATAWLHALELRLFNMNFHVTFHIVLSFAQVITEVTLKGLVPDMFVSDVSGEGAGGGAGHVALRALVVVDVGPHVVAQQPLQGKLLATIVAFKGVLFGHLLALAVIQELDPVREESATVGTPDHLLLGVGPHVLLQLGHGARPAAAVAPSAPHL